MGWKLFALVMTALWIGGVGDMIAERSFDTLEIISLPFGALATAGLYFYAFSLPFGTATFWRVFSMVFAAWSLIAIAIMVVRGVREGNHSLAIAFVAVLIVAVIAFFNWVALRRLSKAA